MKNIFLLLLTAHVLGDFYLQSDKLNFRKNREFHYIVRHCAIYMVVTLIVGLPICKSENFYLLVIAVSLSHFIIDSIKYIFIKSDIIKKLVFLKDQVKIYFIDQILHLIVIFMISYFYVYYNSITVSTFVTKMTPVLNISQYQVVSWTLSLLIVSKPANITIKKLINNYNPEDDSEIDKKSVGAYIGTLERIIILIFLSLNQFSAIGLVLTAKSITRYNKIANEQKFAEYYLLGTLLSFLIAIVTYAVIF